MPAQSDYSYTDEQVNAAFLAISARLFSGKTISTDPKMLIVAGIQGSGKTYLLDAPRLHNPQVPGFVYTDLVSYVFKHLHH